MPSSLHSFFLVLLSWRVVTEAYAPRVSWVSRREALATASSIGGLVALLPPAPARAVDEPAFSDAAVRAQKAAGDAEAAADLALLDAAAEKEEKSMAAAMPAASRSASSSPSTVTYDKFLDMIFRGDVEKVQFYGLDQETVVLTTKDGGERLTVTDVPGGDGRGATPGPMKVVARVRDAKVPYTFEALDLKSFRSEGIELNPFSTIQRRDAATKAQAPSGESGGKGGGLIEKVELPNMNTFQLKLPF